jgi:hypothetical protein
MTPMETFAAWRADIEAELLHANAELEGATDNLATTGAELRTALANRAALTALLEPLSSPIDGDTGYRLVPKIASPLAIRQRDGDREIHRLEGAVALARGVLEQAGRTVAELELALTQLDNLSTPANLEDAEPVRS